MRDITTIYEDATNPALGIDYDAITIAPAPAPAAAAAAPSYGRTSAPPIHASVPISPPRNPLIFSFSSKTRPRLSNVLWPVFSRHAQAPGRWPLLSRSPGKWLGWPISSQLCALPGASHLLFSFFLALIRVNAEFVYFVHRFCADISASDIFRVQDVFVPIALNLGEAFLLGLAIRRPRRAVSIVFFFLAQN